MFDFAWSEFALIGVVALLVIGPKDMPVAIRTVTGLIKKGRKLAGEFQSHVDDMVREADLGEARDQFRQLRSLDVRGKILKTLDSDGSLSRTLKQNPLASDPSAPAGPRALDGAATDTAPVPLDQRHLPISTAPEPPKPIVATWESDSGAEDGADPAPRILPPPVARRLRAERALPPVPSILPPGAVRPTKSGWEAPWRG
jgi:sec-independent protein translocase protein TatB